jgi:hypothetical protein
MLGEECPDGRKVGEVELIAGTREDIGISFRCQEAADGGADHAEVAGDEDAGISLHGNDSDG